MSRQGSDNGVLAGGGSGSNVSKVRMRRRPGGGCVPARCTSAVCEQARRVTRHKQAPMPFVFSFSLLILSHSICEEFVR